jgi:hypothetical protein
MKGPNVPSKPSRPQPPRPLLNNGRPPMRRCYTIHLSKNHQPYIMHIDHLEHRDSTSSSHIVAFRRKDDAMDVARLLEAHHTESAAWPLATLCEGQAYQLLAPNNVELPSKLQHLTLDHWFDGELLDYCNEHFLHQLWISNNDVEVINVPVTLNFARKQFRLQVEQT